ncbi:GntR family transcriptional regulator [Neptunitalea chrysea]|uniref:GntR family transcriptional regulator n=1 Tax=Neptunitalea chrysea TaxID=1647581 RepID=A0A9W6EWW1_9FLAO|nr:S1-like domain-containing RNA-binding protein [Neptunitalea chrysea]GLB53828.1 GntR family transcriptional regulator [Neptunitalea chrysea]
MIQLGVYNKLPILRDTSVGLYLGDINNEEQQILLPNKYVPETFEIGDVLEVFCYLDHEERPVATTLEPFVVLNSFALLKVIQVTEIGAFLDWGLEKHLFVPFREQARKMVEGKWYVVYLYLDETSGRLVGSSKTNNFISNEELTIEKLDEVDLIVSRFTDLGVEVIINQKHKGLVYNNEIFEDLSLGEKRRGVIKKIREDHKIDVSFQQLGYKNIEPSSQKVLEFLKRNNSFLGLHDKSTPEDIEAILGMSKKSFKKSIGYLYKLKIIEIKENGIYLLNTQA